MNHELMAVLTGGLGATLGAGVQWIFNKKSNEAKTKQEQENAESIEIDNEIKLANYYKLLLDDLGERYERKYSEIVAMYDRKVSMLEEEITVLNRRIVTLTQENKALNNLVKQLKAERENG